MLLQAPVAQSQAILDASYSLGKDAKRFLMLVFQQITTKQNQDGWYYVKVSDFAQVYNLTAHEASRDVRGAHDDLWNNNIRIYSDDEILEKRFIIDRTVRRSHGEYGVRFHPDLLPYLHDLSLSFSHKLVDVAYLRNAHHIRLYMWLNARKSDGVIDITVAYLKERLELWRNRSYERYGNIKSRVIEPALVAINETTPLNVQLEEIRQGRIVVLLRFHIAEKSTVNQKLQTAPVICGANCSLSKIQVDQEDPLS